MIVLFNKNVIIIYWRSLQYTGTERQIRLDFQIIILQVIMHSDYILYNQPTKKL